MLDIIHGIARWRERGKKLALATIIQTWGSAPRKTGSGMAISEDQEILGSVSGGCVEGAVVEEAEKCLKSGRSKILEYGITDEDAWTVGLSCGGQIKIFLEPFFTNSTEPESLSKWNSFYGGVLQNRACVLASLMSDEKSDHQLFFPDADAGSKQKLAHLAQKAYAERKSQTLVFEGHEYFFHVFPPKSKLIIIGAAHLTADLVELSSLFGFETIVIDPRGIFSEKMVFHHKPDVIHNKWPAEVLGDLKMDAYTYAVVLSHDPKIDDQALNILLKTDVAYIGALGSRKTHEKRKARLKSDGFTEEEIGKIYGPVGLSINASLPKEIALSIMAQIIQVKNEFL